MPKVLRFLGEELKELLPTVIFLFLLFHLIAISNMLLLETYSLSPTRTAFATLGELVGGKASLVANKLPFVSLFIKKPLIYNVLWRTLIYSILCCWFLSVEELVTGAIRYGGVAGAVHQLKIHMSPSLIAFNMIWLFVGLLLYNSFAALDSLLGRGTIRRLFLVDSLARPELEKLVRREKDSQASNPD